MASSLEGVWVHRHPHFVAFERASRRLQHGRFGLPRWLMDNGFACREERHAHGVQLRKRGAGKGRVRGHMMWLTDHTRICPGKESARTHDVFAAPPPGSSPPSFSTSATSRMLVRVLLVRGPTCLAVQTLEGVDQVSAMFGCFPDVGVAFYRCFPCRLGSRGPTQNTHVQNLPTG